MAVVGPISSTARLVAPVPTFQKNECMTKKQSAAADRPAPSSLDHLTQWIKRRAQVSTTHAKVLAELVSSNAALAARR